MSQHSRFRFQTQTLLPHPSKSRVVSVRSVEGLFKREMLHEFYIEGEVHGIEDAYELPGRLAQLWAYAAGHVDGSEDEWSHGWLRLAVPSETDERRARWPTHPVWKEVQRAFLRDPVRPEHLGKIIASASGNITSRRELKRR
jgi:hypothetical protein